MLRLDQVDVDMIEMALGSQDWPGGYLDPETGTVYPAFQGEVIGDDGDPIDPEEGEDWIAIEPEGSQEPYQDMVEFAEQVTDPGLRRSLDRALEGKGAFRRFRTVMYEDAPEETSRAWNDFRNARSELRALRWLADQDVVDAEELGERIRQVEEASQLTPPPTVTPPGTATRVDLAEKLSLFSEHWLPKVVARLNDYEIKLVKVKGEFVWHSHADTDELFLVIEGTLTIQLRDGDVTLRPGQLYVVPRGVEHRPVADGEVAAMLIEPSGVVNTGDAQSGDLSAAEDTSLLE